MEVVSNLAKALWENLLQAMPFQIIMSYHHGVRWTLGTKPRALRPGIRWRVWLIHAVSTVQSKRWTHSTPAQTVMIGKLAYVFRVNVELRVVDPVKYFEEVHAFEESVNDVITRDLAARVRRLEAAPTAEDMDEMEAGLRDTIAASLKDWGTEILSVGFTDFAPSQRPLRLFTDQRLPL